MRVRRPSVHTSALLASLVALAACGGDGGSGGITDPDPDPSPSVGVLSLGLGEVRTIGAADAAALRVEGTAGGAEFTLIPFYGTLNVSATVPLEISGDQLTAVAGSSSYTAPQPGDLSAGLSLATARAAVEPATTFEARLRRAERVELTGRIRPARTAYAARVRAGRALTASAAAVPAVGSQMTINAAGTASCTDANARTGRVVAVTQHAVVVADNGNPTGGFTDAEYGTIAQEFDTYVHPMVTETFGTPADLDDNGGRVTLFFTRAVNELTPSGAQAAVFGFFNARDVLQRTGETACPQSNEAEIMYAMVPDPSGVVNGNRRSKDLVQRNVVGVLAHEYQHLVNASRRVYVNGATSFEETWLNEGLSTIAEELMFYRVTGMKPRENVGLDALLSSGARQEAINAYQAGNFNRLVEHLRFPESDSPFDNIDDLETRGATWQFLRYAADRTGADEQAFWQKLVNARTTGVANFNAAAGADFLTLLRDWATAKYVDDAVPQAPASYQQPSWNYRSILPTLVPSQTFPLRTWTLGPASPVSVRLRAGGSAYIRFAVPAGATATVRATSGGGAVPRAVSFAVVRTR